VNHVGPGLPFIETLEQTQKRDDGPLAVGNDVNLGLIEIAVDLLQDVVKDREELLTVILELRDDLNVVEIVVEQLLEIELEEPSLVGEEDKPVCDYNALDQFLEETLQTFVAPL
jgi:hypothetical protein